MSKIVNIRLNNAIKEIMPGNIAAYRAENCPNRCARYINDAKDLLLENEDQAIALQFDISSAYDNAMRNYIYALLEMMNIPNRKIDNLYLIHIYIPCFLQRSISLLA